MAHTSASAPGSPGWRHKRPSSASPNRYRSRSPAAGRTPEIPRAPSDECEPCTSEPRFSREICRWRQFPVDELLRRGYPSRAACGSSMRLAAITSEPWRWTKTPRRVLKTCSRSLGGSSPPRRHGLPSVPMRSPSFDECPERAQRRSICMRSYGPSGRLLLRRACCDQPAERYGSGRGRGDRGVAVLRARARLRAKQQGAGNRVGREHRDVDRLGGRPRRAL